MDICMHLSFSWSFLVALVVTRCLELFSVVPRILWVYCLAVLFRMKTLMVFSSHLSRIRSSQLFMCLTKFFGILFDLSKILCSLLFLKFLPACIMVNSIWLVVLDNIPCLSHFEPIDSICAYARSHQVILFKIIFPTQTSFRTWVGSRQFKPLLIVQLSVFNLSILDQSVCFWSFVLETIISFYLSIRLIRWFLNLMPLHSFFLWVSTDTHISSVMDRPIHCWIVIRQCPSYSITLWVLPLIHSAFGKLYPLLGQPCSAFELVYLLLKLVVYVTKMPDGLNLCLPLIRENPKVFTSHTLPVFYQIKFQHYSFIKARGEWNDMH